MIGWGSVIGRAVEFMISKLVGRQVEVQFDDKRRAARVFFELHHLIADLERFVADLTVELRAVADTGESAETLEWLRNVGLAVDRTSQEFLNRSHGIREVLEVVDPALAFAVSELEAHKFSFLAAASGTPFRDPSGKLLTINVADTGAESWSFAEKYDWYLRNMPTPDTEPEQWPDWATWGMVSIAKSNMDVSLSLREPQSLRGFALRLDGHAQVLQRARESLAAFLRERFKLEDLLAVRKTVKKFDPIHAMNRMNDGLIAPPEET